MFLMLIGWRLVFIPTGRRSLLRLLKNLTIYLYCFNRWYRTGENRIYELLYLSLEKEIRRLVKLI